MNDFVHLRVHTEYSIGESVLRVKPLMQKARHAGHPAMAITDNANMFAMVRFYRAAIAAGVKPIIGAELNVLFNEGPREPVSLPVLCRNEEGYLSLSRLLTRAYLGDRASGVVAVPESWLRPETTQGLVALSGGQQGGPGYHIANRAADRARRCLNALLAAFDGDLYIELHRVGRTGEAAYVDGAVELAVATGCPVVATNDVRFLAPDEFEALDARVCIHKGQMLADNSRERPYTEQQFFRSADEMRALFGDLPEALENSVEIARRCTLNLELGQSTLPEFEVPADLDADSFLEQESRRGLESRLARDELPKADAAAYESRLAHELSVISRMGFPGYFLIVADFIKWARDNGVPVGPGRGSGAGSVVAWALGITDLDPLRYELLFERFLNPERVSMPDFDIDFCMEGRDRVIEYVAERYGRDHVSQIITYGTMGAKAVVRDVGRVLGHPFPFVDRVAKLIPMELGMTLRRAMKQESELGDLYEGDEVVRAILDLSIRLEGLVRNAGKHAGGVVIAPSPLTDFTPLYQVEGEDATVTQLDKYDVEAVGLVKFDFLGLRTLTIIDWTVKTINATRAGTDEESLDIAKIPLDDKATFELLQARRTMAVFQLESRGMSDLVGKLQPDCFEDLIPLVALFRPGPLQSGMVDDFIDRRRAGRDSKIDYFHPDLEPVLADTYGVILYQEQVMQIAQRLARYTLGGADLLRRAMGKKNPAEMHKQRSIFMAGATERGVEERLASHIFDLMEKFAGYGFNKSHSAAYAVLTYQTAWLKANYPAAFMASALTSEMGNADKLKLLIEDCAEQGLTVLPPDVNVSEYVFTVASEKEIRYGLGAIKGMGKGAAEGIAESRRSGGCYESLPDFCLRQDTQRVGRRAMEALVRAGAMDSLGITRPGLLELLPWAVGQAEQSARAAAAGQDDMFGIVPDRAEGIPKPSCSDWSLRERLAAEKESLGLYLSGHPFDPYRWDARYLADGDLRTLGSAAAPKNANDGYNAGRAITVAGLVSNVRKRGSRVSADLEDGSGRLEVMFYQDSYARYQHLLQTGGICIVSGRLRFEEFIDGWQIVAREVEEIDRVVEKKARQLIIRWSANGSGPGLDGLKSTLEQFRPGRCEISLYVIKDDAEARLALGPEWTVRPSGELRDRLTDAIGADAFRFVYSQPATG